MAETAHQPSRPISALRARIAARGRLNRRWRQALLAAFGSAGTRAAGVVVSLVATPLLVRALGQERYGVYSLLVGALSLLAFADLGVGNGLVNVVAGTPREALPELRSAVSSAVALLLAVAVAFGLVGGLGSFVWSWPDLLGVQSPDARAQTTIAVAVFGGLFLLGLPVGVGQKVLFGLQEGWRANVWSTMGVVLTGTGLLLVAATQASLPFAVAAALGGALLGRVLMWVSVLRGWWSLRPTWNAVRRRHMRSLLRSGTLFFVLGVAGAVGYETDSLVIANNLGASSVTTYAVTAKLFMFPMLVTGLMLTPLWPAYAEATASGDVAWVRRTLRRSFVIASAVNVPATAALVLGTPFLLRVWIGDGIHAPRLLVAALAGWTLSNVMQGPVAMYLNGVGVIKLQAVTAGAMAVSNLGLSLVLVRTIGVAGPVVGSLISQTLLINVPTGVYLWRRRGSLANGSPP